MQVSQTTRAATRSRIAKFCSLACTTARPSIEGGSGTCVASRRAWLRVAAGSTLAETVPRVACAGGPPWATPAVGAAGPRDWLRVCRAGPSICTSLPTFAGAEAMPPLLCRESGAVVTITRLVVLSGRRSVVMPTPEPDSLSSKSVVRTLHTHKTNKNVEIQPGGAARGEDSCCGS
jgi:hypothetical protein